MSRNGQNIFCRKGVGPILWALVIYACANRGYPEGGPKDTDPPLVVGETPASYTTNFAKKQVEIYFNEFVQLKDINEKFVFSPPLEKNPKVNLKGKYVRIHLPDTLKPNTTYSMDFADAIADNNEGNPLGFYRYVFSTGEFIDTLELGGRLVDAESNEPIQNAMVGLYEEFSDSVPLLKLPDYIARSDSSGNFRLTNLRGAAYRVAAIEDANKDKKYTPEAEAFAYLDTLVRPEVRPVVISDTFRILENIVGKDTVFRDSVVMSERLAYGPGNLYLRMFKEKQTQLYLVDDDRKERERIDFIFSIPADNRLQVRLWDSLATEPLPENWYFMEHSKGRDTISLWIRDSAVYKKDTLHVILSYLRSDSTGQRVPYDDTTRYTFHEKEKTEGKGRKEHRKEPEMKFLEIKSNAVGDLDPGERLWLEFDRPVDRNGLQGLRLSEKVDTLYRAVNFELEGDSLRMRRVYVAVPWKQGMEYLLELDSAGITDIYGRCNAKLEKKFKVCTEEQYGRILLSVKGVTGSTVIQLCKSEGGKSENGRRKYEVIREKKVKEDGEFVFDRLPEGKYRFRAILDSNDNGEWDTGLYLEHRQPEEIVYLPVEMTVKQNFDIEQEFCLDGTYKEGENGK